MKKVIAAPSWHTVVSLYLDALEDEKYTEAVRKEMKSEILRAADLADIYVDLQK